MKCPSSCEVRTPCNNMKKDLTAAATAAKHTKTSPLKEHISAKPQFTPVDVTSESFSLNSGPVNDKENDISHNGELSSLEVSQDSGYLSQHTSRNDAEHGCEEQHPTPTKQCQESRPPTRSPSKYSPSKSKGGVTRSPSKYSPSKSKGIVAHSVTVLTSTPLQNSSTTALFPSNYHMLPIVKFQLEACQKLEKSYRENKRYDFSVVDMVAEHHSLDKVIGRHMGMEYVDVFSSLQSRNIKAMLTKILSLLGDLDLIRCRMVSSSWRKIINEDAAAFKRCQAMLKESRNSSGQENWCFRSAGNSRVVLSSMQSCASPSSSSSTTPNHRTNSQTPAQKSKDSRLSEFIQAAGGLKQHESLRSCRLCGSPAKHQEQAQRATCTRASCGFEFCTCCQETFHGSTPCRTVTPRIARHSSKMSALLPGSARSKRNVRRL